MVREFLWDSVRLHGIHGFFTFLRHNSVFYELLPPIDFSVRHILTSNDVLNSYLLHYKHSPQPGKHLNISARVNFWEDPP